MFEDARAFDDHIRSRFTAMRQRTRRVERTIHEETLGQARALAADARVASLIPDAVDRSDVERRIARGLSDASSSGESLLRLARHARDTLALHGTGSWALAGIARDGAIVAGGDGLTGEVAMTNVVEPDVFVFEWRSPIDLYAAVGFAVLNAAWSGGELTVSAARLGHPPIEEALVSLFFGDEAAGGTPSRSPYFRVRDPDVDRLTLAALEHVVERAQSGMAPAATGWARRIGVPSVELAEHNLVFAIRVLAGKPPDATLSPADVLQHAPRLRGLLVCDLPEDDEATRFRKATVGGALRAQFPVVLAAESAGLGARPDPSYAWSSERRVPHRISLDRVALALVPGARRGEVADVLASRGRNPIELLPLEDFEVLRVVAETPTS